jgi:hypothetical protein
MCVDVPVNNQIAKRISTASHPIPRFCRAVPPVCTYSSWASAPPYHERAINVENSVPAQTVDGSVYFSATARGSKRMSPFEAQQSLAITKKYQFSLGVCRRDISFIVEIGSLSPPFVLVFMIWHGAVSTDTLLREASCRSASGDIYRTEATLSHSKLAANDDLKPAVNTKRCPSIHLSGVNNTLQSLDLIVLSYESLVKRDAVFQ